MNDNKMPKYIAELNAISYRSCSSARRSDWQILNGRGRIFQISNGIIGGGERRSGGAEGRVGGEHEGAILSLLRFVVVVSVEGG